LMLTKYERFDQGLRSAAARVTQPEVPLARNPASENQYKPAGASRQTP
jgi:hypothetical protein